MASACALRLELVDKLMSLVLLLQSSITQPPLLVNEFGIESDDRSITMYLDEIKSIAFCMNDPCNLSNEIKSY